MNFIQLQKLKKLLTCFCRTELQKKRTIVFYTNLLYRLTSHERGRIEKPELFDYNAILSRKHFFCDEFYKANSLYGTAPNLRKYSGYDKPIKACLEHGVYFGVVQIPSETFDSGLPGIINFSNFRKKHLRPITSKPIIPIGPYIHYVESYCTEEEVRSYKRKFGKTLLVFPSHSLCGVTTHYDYQNWIDFIEKIKKEHEFKTVVVCLYYTDIELSRNEIYEGKGYLVTCCGRRNDPDFLRRQRALISIADYTISNSVGTHIGYCVYMEKPHIVFNQQIQYTGAGIEQAVSKIEDEAIKNTNEVKKEFILFTNHITEAQKAVCEKFWGFSEIKTPEEICEIFKKLDRVFTNAHHRETEYTKEAAKVFGEDCEYLM